jgi:hypothetical protein
LAIDFEGLTLAGRPAAPIEVAALALRPLDLGGLDAEAADLSGLVLVVEVEHVVVQGLQLSAAAGRSGCGRPKAAKTRARSTGSPSSEGPHHSAPATSSACKVTSAVPRVRKR